MDKEKSLERLEIVQQKLFDNQTKINKSLENSTIDVLVENRMDDKSKLFGRSEYMTSVLFSGSNDLIGKLVKVKIKKSNQNTLFGEVETQSNQKVA
jgi:tRNA-2-methylthio-N6-dimethylallyladenosine synthase